MLTNKVQIDTLWYKYKCKGASEPVNWQPNLTHAERLAQGSKYDKHDNKQEFEDGSDNKYCYAKLYGLLNLIELRMPHQWHGFQSLKNWVAQCQYGIVLSEFAITEMDCWNNYEKFWSIKEMKAFTSVQLEFVCTPERIEFSIHILYLFDMTTLCKTRNINCHANWKIDQDVAPFSRMFAVWIPFTPQFIQQIMNSSIYALSRSSVFLKFGVELHQKGKAC